MRKSKAIRVFCAVLAAALLCAASEGGASSTTVPPQPASMEAAIAMVIRPAKNCFFIIEKTSLLVSTESFIRLHDC